MEKKKITWLEAKLLQPSQFYINENKLEVLKAGFDPALCDPIPLARLGDDLVMTDGHTRACAMVQAGFLLLPTIEEWADLNWEAYQINVRDCKKRGIFSALDLDKCLVPDQFFNEEWTRYCDEVQDRVIYLQNPCKASALPYWKEKTLTRPDFIEVFHEDVWRDLTEDHKGNFVRTDCFFKLRHPLESILPPALPADYRFRTFDPGKETDFDQALEIIQAAYPGTDLTKSKLKNFTKNTVYDSNLWLFVDGADEEIKRPLAFGLADLDPLVREGILEWIQVMPKNQRQGLGSHLLAELLWRMKGKADFVTVSGDCMNPLNPLNFYRKAGFTDQNNWIIASKNRKENQDEKDSCSSL